MPSGGALGNLFHGRPALNRYMELNQKDLYFVAVKVFFTDHGKLLMLKDRFGDWDLPGGRIKADEFDAPLEAVIARKLKEELGGEVVSLIRPPAVFMRHERIEESEGHPTVRIFALGYEGYIERGVIHLSERHSGMEWVSMSDLVPETYFKGGWLKGVQEYLALKRAAANISVPAAGDIYCHYKHSDRYYEIVGVGVHSETKERVVIYRALYDSPEFGAKALWVRPQEMFLGTVTVDGREVPRFLKVS